MNKKQKSFKQLVKNFDTGKPDFSEVLPYLTGEQKTDLEDFRGNMVGKWGAIKTLWQLSQPDKPTQRSRVWKSPQGYKFLVQWSNAVLLRILGVKLFKHLKSSNKPIKSSKTPLDSSISVGWKLFDRTEAQFLDSLRSVIANIEEGFARPTTSEYLQFLGYSQASLKEAKGDIERMLQDKFIDSKKNSSLKDIGIDLKKWNDWCKDPTNSSELLSFPLNRGNYRTLKEISGKELTYEQFVELINKTDYLLRKLVETLEKKLDADQKRYRIEKARIRSNLKLK